MDVLYTDHATTIDDGKIDVRQSVPTEMAGDVDVNLTTA